MFPWRDYHEGKVAACDAACPEAAAAPEFESETAPLVSETASLVSDSSVSGINRDPSGTAHARAAPHRVRAGDVSRTIR